MNSHLMLEHIIRTTLKTKPVFESKIKTSDQLKYTFAKNIKTQENADAFANWVRENYAFAFNSYGLKRKGNSIDDPNLKKAFDEYGKEWIDATNFASDPDVPWYYPTTGKVVWTGIIGVLLYVGYQKFKFVKKILSASTYMGLKKYRRQLALTKMSPTEIEEIIQFIQTLGLRSGGARKKYVQDQIAKFLENQGAKNAKQDSEKLLNAIENDPALKSAIKIEITGAAAENFMNNKGVSASDLKQMFEPETWKKYGKEFEEIEKKRKTGSPKKSNKTSTSKTTSTPSKLSLTSFGKLLGSKGQVWTVLQGKTVSPTDIAQVMDNVFAGGVKTQNHKKLYLSQVIDAISQKLKKPAGDEKGLWLLTKHLNASKFPTMEVWESDMKAAKVTRQLSEVDYYASKTIWNLAK